MNRRGLFAVLLLVAVAGVLMHSQLWTVARPGVRAPLSLIASESRRPAVLGMTLPAVPAGSQRVDGEGGVLLIHYWAPWESGSREQVASLDSLRQLPEMQGLRVMVVCFDPFPSVARYVARQRLRLSVLIDGRGELRYSLPCPSVPYTYVVDRNGEVAVKLAGNVDWLAPATRAALAVLLAEHPRNPDGKTAAWRTWPRAAAGG